jgi:hypothetical protein
VSATRVAPRPTATPIPMTRPMTTAMNVRIAEEGTASTGAPPAPARRLPRTGRPSPLVA